MTGFPCGLPNMNGIVATEDGNWLIVNNTASGELSRVDRPPAHPCESHCSMHRSAPVTDGLLLHGTTLYSVENYLNRIAVIDLSKDPLTGTIEGYITSPNFDVPATAAFMGGRDPRSTPASGCDRSAPPQRDDDVVRVSR